MSYDIESNGRRIPTLVQYCQRVVCANVENICSLGEGWRYDIIGPVLESCSPETLLRFEDADPYLTNDTADIWKALVLKEFPIAAHQYECKAMEEPESWRDELFALRDEQRQKFAKLSVKLKASRQEEEVRKKESAIKLIDKVPSAKRARSWGAPSQPRTLFQKTKSEALRIQKGIFGPRISRPTFQTQRLTSHTASAKPPPPPKASTSTSSGSRVVVRSVPVTQKPPLPKQIPSTPIKAANTRDSNVPLSTASSPPRQHSPPTSDPQSPPKEANSPPIRSTVRKDKSATLFMPKSRAYSQLPRGVQSKS